MDSLQFFVETTAGVHAPILAQSNPATAAGKGDQPQPKPGPNVSTPTVSLQPSVTVVMTKSQDRNRILYIMPGHPFVTKGTSYHGPILPPDRAPTPPRPSSSP